MQRRSRPLLLATLLSPALALGCGEAPLEPVTDDAAIDCRCDGDVLGTSVHLACGETTCLDGERFECSAAQAFSDLGPCDDGDAGMPGTSDAGRSDAATTITRDASDGTLCTNTCAYAADGECDDGAAGSMFAVCAYGTDCADCGPRPPTCTPSCSGRSCGADGCGGTCGSCAAGESCGASGRCEATCTPSCAGRVCGSDGCGGACGAGCAAGSFCSARGTCESSCTPSAEICNGADDDCNGLVDDAIVPTPCEDPAFPLGTACRSGLSECRVGTWSACVTPAPTVEACNGADDDCDGLVDDLGTASCGVGVCARTVDRCVGGMVEVCAPGTAGTETCNGLDDDCDGTADDGLGEISCGLGACAARAPACAGGAPGTCTPGTPGIETCNAIDDDCDGVVDGTAASASCGPGQVCSAGSCGVIPTPVRTLAEGRYHGCAVRSDGTVRCWGHNDASQLGDATEIDSATPVTVAGLTSVVEVSAGYDFSCARRSTGTVYCWGSGAYGQIGDGSVALSTRTAPTRVLLPSSALEIVSGDFFSCARTTSAVYCWGWNVHGELGDGTTTLRRSPVPVAGLTDAVELAASDDHVCARRASGAVACWGSNASGEAGDGSTMDRSTPVNVTGLADAVEIGLGQYYSCARRATGAIVCWGGSSAGALGNGTTMRQPTPTPVSGISDAVRFAASSGHACAVRASGAVWCWGANGDRQLGDGTRVTSLVPVPSAIASGATGLVLGADRSCASLSSGAVRCWGNDRYGQLGDGTTTTHLTPVAGVDVATDVVEVATGVTHSCGRSAVGSVACWGNNTRGTLGDGTTITPSGGSVAVVGLSDAVELGAGNDFTCARRSSGRVVCWGDNLSFTLGIPSGTQITPMTDVTGLLDARALAVGYDFACALRATGAVVCWGNGNQGALGNGMSVDQRAPVTVSGLTDATQITAGGGPTHGHACARRATGAVVCWGFNGNGALGNGTTSTSNVPVTVTGLTDAVEVRAGDLHTCARRASGAVSCWGKNLSYQLGDGSRTERTTPVSVTGLGDATALALGGDRSCARRATGALVCWGQNRYFGTLGDGTITDSSTPVTVVGASGSAPFSVSPASVLSGHACLARGTTAPLCWGDNQSGQLGHTDPLVVTLTALP